VPDLPGAVHLVAQAPVLHAVPFPLAVRGAQVAVVRAGGEVHVLHEVGGVLDAAGAEVHGPHRFRAEFAGEVHELVRSELVRFGGAPREGAAAGPLGFRADAVLPAVAGHEVPARVAHDAVVGLAQGGHHVAAQAAFVGEGRGRVVDALVDAASHVFGEAAEDEGRDRADGSPGVQGDAGGERFWCRHVAPVRVRTGRDDP